MRAVYEMNVLTYGLKTLLTWPKVNTTWVQRQLRLSTIFRDVLHGKRTHDCWLLCLLPALCYKVGRSVTLLILHDSQNKQL